MLSPRGPRRLSRVAAVAAHLLLYGGFFACAQPLQEDPPTPIPSHSAIYTTTMAFGSDPAAGGAAVQGVTATVTVVMPATAPGWPRNGGTVVGSAVSHLRGTILTTPAAHAGAAPTALATATATWDETRKLTWTMSGNVTPNDWSSPAVTLQGAHGPATTTVTSSYTTVDHMVASWRTDSPGNWPGIVLQEWFTTYRVTLFDPIDADYPDTVRRLGYTRMDMTVTEVIVGDETPYMTSTSTTMWAVTTLVNGPRVGGGGAGR